MSGYFDPAARYEREQQQRRQHPIEREQFSFGRILAALAWIGCGIGTLCVAGFFIRGIAYAQSAPQEASIAAMSAFMVIGLYVLARSFTKLIDL